VLARENFPLRMMGTVIGGTAMAGSLGMATGPLAGGLIYDAFASYAWLYIGSWIMGIGAFLIAHGVAENSPEQPDIGAQPGVGFERLSFVGAFGAKVGVGHLRGLDLGRHG